MENARLAGPGSRVVGVDANDACVDVGGASQLGRVSVGVSGQSRRGPAGVRPTRPRSRARPLGRPSDAVRFVVPARTGTARP